MTWGGGGVYRCMHPNCGLVYPPRDWCPNGHGADTWSDVMLAAKATDVRRAALALLAGQLALKVTHEAVLLEVFATEQRLTPVQAEFLRVRADAIMVACRSFLETRPPS